MFLKYFCLLIDPDPGGPMTCELKLRAAALCYACAIDI
jgi:hypothetical protein